MDRISQSFAGDPQAVVQVTSIDSVEAAEAAMAAVQPIEDLVTPTSAEPENVSQQLAALLTKSNDVEVTRSAGFSIDTLEQARDVA